MIFLIVLPWLAGLFAQEPYGYAFAVGAFGGILGFMATICGLVEVLFDGEWRFVWLAAYGFGLYAGLT